ncbi:MAG: apolipoprotein N-acyltransferase [Alphaproteobacteria bacterium]|nr:apolipoprotein N-acyltransferase [Alphaproteobacteria bacterium]
MLKYSTLTPRSRLFTSFVFCFIAGSFSSLAMAPTNIWLLLFIGISVLYYAVAHLKSSWSAFFNGWFFGFGYFLFGLSWIGNALLVEGNPYAWAWPLSVTCLPFLLSFFPALACLLSKKLSNIKSLSGYMSFTALLFLSELLRGHIFTGFPWNLYGYAWANILPIVQTVSFVNIYGLTALSILWAGTFGFIALKEIKNKDKVILSSICALSFLACFGYGSWKLNTTTIKFHEDIQIRLVQPNIPQHEKWDRRKMTEIFFKHIRMSLPTINKPELPTTKATYIIWPETALSYQYTQDKTAMNVLTEALKNAYINEAYILTGLLRKDQDNKTLSNSLVMIDKNGKMQNIYDKHHLVPFGEYIPFKKWIPLETVTKFSGFSSGEKAKTYKTPEGFRYSPLICYEAIFPGLIPRNEKERPDFIINVTNDAWYGISAGPHQHLAQTVFRAVEEGIPVIRAANTGISAIIDPLGRVIHKDNLFHDGSALISIPKKIVCFSKSIYTQIIGLLVVSLIIVAFGYKKKYITTN